MDHSIESAEAALNAEIQKTLVVTKDPKVIGSRAKSFRASERNVDGRPSLEPQVRSMFNIPREVKDADPDYVYGCIPCWSGGECLQDSFTDAQERGWEALTIGDNPILDRYYATKSIDLSGHGSRTNTGSHYMRKGQMVMKRRKEIHEAENDYYKKIDEHKNEQYAFMRDYRIPQPS